MAALVRRHGWNTNSFQVLEPGYRYLFVGDDACVAYVDTGHAWVAAGAPLAADNQLAEVTATFIQAARAASRRACLFATEARFTSLVTSLRALPIGEQPVWNPADWPATLARDRRAREQLRRARAKGIRVRAVDPRTAVEAGDPTGVAIADLVRRWLRARSLAPLGFVVRAEPFTLLPAHRLFLAERDGRLVALLAMAPICARNGWLLQHLIRSPGAPNGTIETLIDHAMRWAASEGAAMVTLGLAPLAGEVPRSLRIARRLGSALFDFQGLRSFKAKLRPARWERVWLSYGRGTSAARAVADLLTAFAPDGILRFGLRTLWRGPSILMQLLLGLLVPWTALLAMSDSLSPASRWFPHPAIKWAWVLFDAGLVLGLGALQKRWRDGLARALMTALATDAVLTLSEAWFWNLTRTTALGARALMALAIGGPPLALLALWRTWARRRSARA